MIIEERKEVQTFNVYAKCNCGGLYEHNVPYIVWDNKGTKSLSDDTFEYSYKCNNCSEVVISKIQYPHQEFIEI